MVYKALAPAGAFSCPHGGGEIYGKPHQRHHGRDRRRYHQAVQALEGVNKDIKGTQTQLKDVQKLLKFDPSNTELLSQKHKLLADAVSATKEKLEVLKTAAEQANTALANGEIPSSSMMLWSVRSSKPKTN